MSVILLAHGSRHPSAASGVEALASSVAASAGVDASVAYLDLCPPSVGEVAQPGDTVVPLLFTDAFHSRVDVPAAVSGLDVSLTPGLAGPALLDVLASQVTCEHVVLYAVGSSSAVANDTVVDLASALASRCSVEVSVAFATRGPSVLEAAAGLSELQVLPLFVTSGLLLDKLHADLPRIEAATGCSITVSPPLTTALTPVVEALI